jgi:hypothetical protein
MNLFGTSFRFGGALVIGAAAVLLAPILLPVVAGIVRPIAKGLIKGGILAYEGVKVAVAEAQETIEDVAAEAAAEIAESRQEAAPPPPPARTRKQASA